MDDLEIGAGRKRPAKLGQGPLQQIDSRHHIGAGLALHVNDDGRLALVPATDAGVFQAIDDIGHILQQHRRIVAIRDDDGAVGAGRRDLVVGGDRVGLRGAVERTLRSSHIGRHDGVPQILDRNAISSEAGEVSLDADGRSDVAFDRHMADAGHLAEARPEQCVSDVAETAQRDRVGGQRQGQDRRVGRVHLGIGRRVGKVLGQRRCCGIDGRLHVLRRGVDVATELELQGDLAEAEGALRRHGR